MRLNEGTTEEKVKEWTHNVIKSLRGWSYAPVQNANGVHGIPDRVACVPIQITPEMVGTTIGVFVGIECKRPGRRGEKNAGHTGAQVTQLRDIIGAHGIGLSVDSEDDLALFLRSIAELRAGRKDLKELLIHVLEGRVLNKGKGG